MAAFLRGFCERRQFSVEKYKLERTPTAEKHSAASNIHAETQIDGSDARRRLTSWKRRKTAAGGTDDILIEKHRENYEETDRSGTTTRQLWENLKAKSKKRTTN
jgi:hypothetical protein